MPKSRILSDALHQNLIQNHHPRHFLRAMASFLHEETQALRVSLYSLNTSDGDHEVQRLMTLPEPAVPFSDFAVNASLYETLALSASAGAGTDFPGDLQALFSSAAYVQIWPCVSSIWEGFWVFEFEKAPQKALVLDEVFLQTLASTLGWMLHGRRVEAAWRSLKDEHGELKRRLKTVISNLPGFVYRQKSKAQKMMFLSPGVFEVTGYQRESFYEGDINLRDLIVADQREEVERQIHQAVRLRQPYEITYLCEVFGKEPRWFWERGRGVFNNQGELRYYEGFITDITEQKDNEQALAQLNQNLEARVESRTRELQERQAIFDTIVNNAQDGIILIDDQENILFWNHSAEKIFGYTADEVLGENLHRLLAPDYYQDAIHTGFKHFVKTGTGPILDQLREVKARHKAGHELDIELSISGVERKGTYHAVGIVRDISMRKSREAQLRVFHQLSEASAQGITMMNLSQEILYINPTLAKMFGEDDPAQVVGKSLGSFYSEVEQQRFHDEIMPILMQEKNWVGELELCSSRGGCIPTLQNFFMIENADGEATAIAVMVTNIMQQKGVQRTLELAQKAADEANQAKSVFLANMSHEIRTPMNAIIGLGHLLQKTDLTPKQGDYATKIQSAAQNLLGIINDILDFSKIEANKMDIEHISFDLHRVLSNISTLLAVKAQDKDLELIFKINSEVPRFLIGDPLRLEQVFLNLLNNALKFTQVGSITVVGELLWERDKELFLRFEVRDTGIGMSQAQQDKLFQAFSQADASTSRKFGGTGLGLTISERLVKMMGGEIGLTSQEGVGSTFFFTLKTERDEQLQPLVLPVDLQKKRVLVVDDQPVVLEVMEDYLQHFNMQCEVANSGEDAIARYRRAKTEGRPFDLVILDWNMPEMDGIETLGQLRQLIDHEHPTKIFMMTAYGREDIVETLRQLHVDNLLLKPVTQSVLYDHLIEHLSEGAAAVVKRAGSSNQSMMNLSAIRGASVLLVEDNLINQQIAQELLEEEGLKVEVVQNGKEALDLLQAHLPEVLFDAVLMDLQMPIMDGYEATLQLRKEARFNTLPIIAMTADAVTGVRERVLEVGMNDYVTKPIQLDLLASALLRWIPARVTEDAEQTAAVTSAQAAASPASIAHLRCLNYEEALARLAGKVPLLQRLLIQFVEENNNSLTLLNADLEARRWETAKHVVHTIKGTAGNLGLNAIYQAAFTLEQQLGQCVELSPALQKAFEQFKKAMREAMDEIRHVLLAEETSSLQPAAAWVGQEAAGGHQPLRFSVLENLKTAVLNFDASASAQIAELLSQAQGGPYFSVLQEIESAIEGFEQEEALSGIEALEAQLRAEGATESDET